MAETYCALTDLIRLCDKTLEDKPISFSKGIVSVRDALIYHAPAADVAEVRHGQWTPWSYKGMGLLPVSGWKCSECGVIMDGIEDTPTAYHLHYCPNCGAKMEDGK